MYLKKRWIYNGLNCSLFLNFVRVINIMPMIEQLKNFIGDGKQANNGNKNDRYPKSTLPIDNFRAYPEVKSRVDNSSAIQQIVAEEREQRNKVPTYPGLERYQILEKMGEYVESFFLCLRIEKLYIVSN